MAGVTPTGFVPKTLGELQTEVGAGLRSVYGASLNLDSRSRFGQLRDLFASALASLWQLGEVLAGTYDPNGVNGVLLDNLAALTDTYRRPAFPSSVSLIVTGDTGTVLPALRRARVNGTSTVFEMPDAGLLVAAAAWGAGAVLANDVVASDDAVWICLVGGTAATAPTGAGPVFVDGAVQWRRLGDGDAYDTLTAAATANGPLQGYAGTISVIDTPVAGWSSVTNLLDATPGALVESDAALRVRRHAEIAALGSSPLPAILAKLLRVDAVTAVTVFENTTDATVDGITPHAVEALVEGGADTAIREALFRAKGGGIETCGGVSGAVVDAAGNSHTIKFSRVADVDIYVRLELVVNPGEFPADGADLIKEELVAWGDLQKAGRDVVSAQLMGRAFNIPGVLDGVAKIKTSFPATATTTIPISLRQKAVYDTSRIVVVTTPGVP